MCPFSHTPSFLLFHTYWFPPFIDVWLLQPLLRISSPVSLTHTHSDVAQDSFSPRQWEGQVLKYLISVCGLIVADVRPVSPHPLTSYWTKYIYSYNNKRKNNDAEIQSAIQAVDLNFCSNQHDRDKWLSKFVYVGVIRLIRIGKSVCLGLVYFRIKNSW